MRLIYSLFPFSVLLFLTIFLSEITKKSFGKNLPITISIITITMYISQMVGNTFKFGYLIILIGCAISIIYIIINFIKNNLQNNKTGIVSFFILFLFIFIIDYKCRFFRFDEFYHWGMMVKEQLRLDHFYSVNESLLWIHKDYPPFVPLFETFWCRFANGYSEMNVSVAMHVITLSFILPQFNEKFIKNKKNIIRTILICIINTFIFLVTILFFDGDKIVFTILPDAFIGVLFGAAIIHIMKMDFYSWFDWLYLTFLYCFLIMTKQVGISFILVITILLAMRIFFHKKQINYLRKILLILYPICVSLLLLYTWNNYIGQFSIWKQFDLSKISFQSYIASIFPNNETLLHKTFWNYIGAIFSRQINSGAVISITFFSAQAIVVAICFFLLKRDNIILNIVLFIGALGYAFMMSILYLFTFNESEMNILICYERYMSTYIMGEIVAVICLWFYENDNRQALYKYFVFLLLFFVILAPNNCYNLIPKYFSGNPKEQYEKEGRILNTIVPSASKVIIIYNTKNIDQSWYGAYQVYMQYFCVDRKIYHSDTNIFTWNMEEKENQDKLISDLQKNDYLYIRETNNSLSNFLSNYVYSGDIHDFSFFKILSEGDQLLLIPEFYNS